MIVWVACWQPISEAPAEEALVCLVISQRDLFCSRSRSPSSSQSIDLTNERSQLLPASHRTATLIRLLVLDEEHKFVAPFVLVPRARPSRDPDALEKNLQLIRLESHLFACPR